MPQSQISCNACSSGDLVMRGKGTYSELFSDGSGNRYLSGLQGQINVKHDGSGSVNVQPGTSEFTHCTRRTPSAPVRWHAPLAALHILHPDYNHLVWAQIMPICFHQRCKASLLRVPMKRGKIAHSSRLRCMPSSLHKPVLSNVQAIHR